MLENNNIQKQLREVAQRIYNMREIMNISEQSMADYTGVTLEEYRDYETGEKDFSFTFIYKCAKCFGIDPTDLLSGSSPTLSGYEVTRSGQGLPITRTKGYTYKNLASMFKNKSAEPYWVKIPKTNDENNVPLSTHEGQEFDIVISGKVKFILGSNVEVLEAGDSIYYNSSIPHGLCAIGEDAELYAMVINNGADSSPVLYTGADAAESVIRPEQPTTAIYKNFIETTKDDKKLLTGIGFKNEKNFNFAFDVVDALAKKAPDKCAMIYVANDKTDRRFTFKEISSMASQTANYFESLGIKRGDKVILILKRHYQFWLSMLALHKIGAIAIPATNLLVEHDLEYRFNAAGITTVLCTSDGDVSKEVDKAAAKYGKLVNKIMVGDARDDWHDFNAEFTAFSDVYERRPDSPGGEDLMLMYFTSGTTGHPKITSHSHFYALGHFITAKYWHNVNPDGIHFTISDTGWGKAVWGKFYGQWLCETCIFVYDFDKFNADDILPMFKKYGITTFCAPPTMYRFFIKEDLSKYDLSSLEYSTVAGEALNPEVYEQWKKATGLKLMEGFGQTETTLVAANLRGMNPKPGSMGKPTPLYDVDIVRDDGTSADVGETGEIVIKIDKGMPYGLFAGYYNSPEKTEEAWQNGYYHTGDTAWKDEDGYFWYVGRIDDVIKSSGYRIGPFEIESVIMELPYVLECAITPAPDPIRGQVVKATITLTKGTEGTDELKKEIQDYVKKNTAPYKYPRIVDFVDELPKTISGKIRRVEIRNKDN